MITIRCLQNAVNSIDSFHNDVKLIMVCVEDIKNDIDNLNLTGQIRSC
jgi:hypothetical protein